jgi:hypothetical protein
MRDARLPEDLPDLDIRKKEFSIGDDAGLRIVSGWAIAAGYLALFSVLCLPAPFALLAGIMAMREMYRDPSKHGMGRAKFGIVMGGIGTALLLLCLYIEIMAGLSWK